MPTVPTPGGGQTHSVSSRTIHGYTGPDRRKPATAADFRAEAWRIVGGVSIAVTLWIVTVGLAVRSPAGNSLAISLAHGVTGALLLASAALALAVWRITGTTRAACAVVGLSLAGLSSPVMGILSRAVNSNDVRADLVGMLAVVTELVLIGCVGAALLLPQVTTRLRPLCIATPIIAACVVGAASILAADASRVPSPMLTDIASAMRVTNLALWLAAAAAWIVTGFRRQRQGDVALGFAVLLPAAGAVGRIVIGPINFQTRILPTGFALAGACLIAGMATVALWRLHTWHGSKLIEVVGKLRTTRTDLADLESDQARRLHDARNAIFAIAGATELLAHPADRDELTPDRLQRLISAELDRLSHLLDPGFRGSDRTFTAADLISPLVAAYRARGVNIDADVAPVQIHSRRDLLVGVITNILTNARTHAPRARIWITARPIGYDAALGQSAVRIEIADDGPGIPLEQREAVLLPGVRGSSAACTPGHGLGLASAVQALSEVGGTLRLSEREGGGTVVTVTIPTAAPRRADMDFVDRAHTIDARKAGPARAIGVTPAAESAAAAAFSGALPHQGAPAHQGALPHQTAMR